MNGRIRAVSVVVVLAAAASIVALAAREPRAQADAPPCRYTLPGDGTVVDNETGLTWQQSATAGNMTAAQSATYCQNLGLAGGGWRISTIEELQTLVDVTRSSPALDPTAFPDGFVVSLMWSGTAKANTGGASYWYIDPATGGVHTLQANFAGGPRCVR